MTLIDSHAHLDADEFKGDCEAVVHRAEANHLEAVVSCGTTVASSRRNVELAEKFPIIFAAVGIHPHETDQIEDNSMTQLRKLAKQMKVVAIGETGLDYYYNFSLPEMQKKSLALHVRLAREVGLPLVVHCRNAEQDLVQILKQEKASEVGGVIHCFAGTARTAEACLELGFYLGVGGMITFKSAEALGKILASMPLERLVVETDCPYLSPAPHRGKRNEPAFVSFTAAKLAELKSLPVEEIHRATTQNAKKLFRLKIGASPHSGTAP